MKEQEFLLPTKTNANSVNYSTTLRLELKKYAATFGDKKESQKQDVKS